MTLHLHKGQASIQCFSSLKDLVRFSILLLLFLPFHEKDPALIRRTGSSQCRNQGREEERHSLLLQSSVGIEGLQGFFIGVVFADINIGRTDELAVGLSVFQMVRHPARAS